MNNYNNSKTIIRIIIWKKNDYEEDENGGRSGKKNIKIIATHYIYNSSK